MGKFSVLDAASGSADLWLRQQGCTGATPLSTTPWGRVYRLDFGRAPSRILKVVTAAHGSPDRLPELLSRRGEGRAPRLLGARPNRGLFIYEDLDLDRMEPPQTPTNFALLMTYGQLQSTFLQDSEMAAAMPAYSASKLLDLVFSLLADTKSTHPGNVFAAMDAGDRAAAQEILERHTPLLRALAARIDAAPRTINHTDLNTQNFHQRASGEICFLDWDDAIFAAPGWSLHMLFSGVSALYAGLDALDDPGVRSPDVDALRFYAKRLMASGVYDRESLRLILPAAATFGVLKYIADTAPYPWIDADYRAAMVSSTRRRLQDLADFLPKYEARIRNELFPNQGQITTTIPPESLVPFPEITPNPADPKAEAAAAAALFHENGAVLVRDCLPQETIAAIQAELETSWASYEADIAKGGALRVGPKRYMVSLHTEDALGSAAVLAPPKLTAIFDRVLGGSYILGSLTAVISLPGADHQAWHSDNEDLFPEGHDSPLPAFSIAAIIPLVATNAEIGATEVNLGTHHGMTGAARNSVPAVQPGDCYLMDCRVQHRGLPNRSQIKRPILSLVYQRPWYRDFQNFNKQVPLKISAKTLAALPKQHRPLVAWAAT